MKQLCGTKCLDILNLTRGKVCEGKASMISVRCHKLARTTDIQNWDRAMTHDTRPSRNLLQHKQHLCKISKILLCHTKCKKIINSPNYSPYIETSMLVECWRPNWQTLRLTVHLKVRTVHVKNIPDDKNLNILTLPSPVQKLEVQVASKLLAPRFSLLHCETRRTFHSPRTTK